MKDFLDLKSAVGGIRLAVPGIDGVGAGGSGSGSVGTFKIPPASVVMIQLLLDSFAPSKSATWL